MNALQELDQILRKHDQEDRDYWSDEGVVFGGQFAARLTAQDMNVLARIWKERSPMWQKHCADVLDCAMPEHAVDILIDMAEQAPRDVAFAAIGSLRDFDLTNINPHQAERIANSIAAMQAKPMGPLHNMVMEALLKQLGPRFV